MKVLALIEHLPNTGRIKRGRFRVALEARGFVNLPDAPGGWVADHKYATVGEAKDAVVEAAAVAAVAIRKAYVIEYGNFAVYPG